MGVSRARVTSALLSAARVAAAMPASAGETEHTKSRLSDYIRHFTVGYERLPLSVGDTTYYGDGLPNHKGKELGFSSPIAHVLDVRWEFDVARTFVVVLDTYMGGWAWVPRRR